MSTTIAVTRARWYRPGSVMKAGTAEPSAPAASLSCGDPFSAEARTVPAIAARMERASLPAMRARWPVPQGGFRFQRRDRGRQGRVGQGRSEAQPGRADAEFVLRAQNRRAVDGHVVDEGSVCRVVVFDNAGAVQDAEDRVPARHG